MDYINSEMKIDAFVSYINDAKINLSPAFQRGHVWTLKQRRKLLKNIVMGKPIPAIFLYKEASGSKYSYNILDGKQRLESLILFIGSKRDDLRIPNWSKYFYGKHFKKEVHFPVEFGEASRPFHELSDDLVREFREYAIPTIEISLEDSSLLEEIITLFVDINQQGVAVKRFDIVKALRKKDPLLKCVFDLIARQEARGQDVLYKMISNEFTRVLKRLQIIEKAPSANAKVNRMWERLLEIALFFNTRKHRKPVEILKGFIGSGSDTGALTGKEIRQFRQVFQFLEETYKTRKMEASRLFRDQTHFYTMITAIIGADLMALYERQALQAKLSAFSKVLDGAQQPALPEEFKQYQEYSTKQTTDISRRGKRQEIFISMLAKL